MILPLWQSKHAVWAVQKSLLCAPCCVQHIKTPMLLNAQLLAEVMRRKNVQDNKTIISTASFPLRLQCLYCVGGFQHSLLLAEHHLKSRNEAITGGSILRCIKLTEEKKTKLLNN